MIWTPELEDRAAALWAKNVTVSEIAKTLGLSKGQLMGKAARKREKFPPKPKLTRPEKIEIKPVLTRKSREGMSLKQKREACDRDAEEDAKLITDDVKNEYDQSRMAEALELVELNNRQCHWPVNSGGPFLFCAAEAKEGKLYCTHHHSRMHYRAPREN